MSSSGIGGAAGRAALRCGGLYLSIRLRNFSGVTGFARAPSSVTP